MGLDLCHFTFETAYVAPLELGIVLDYFYKYGAPLELEHFHQSCSGGMEVVPPAVFWALGFVSARLQVISNLRLRRSLARSPKVLADCHHAARRYVFSVNAPRQTSMRAVSNGKGIGRRNQRMLVSFVRCGSKGRNRVAVEGGLGACTLGSSPTRNPGLWAGIPLGFSEGWGAGDRANLAVRFAMPSATASPIWITALSAGAGPTGRRSIWWHLPRPPLADSLQPGL